MAILSGVVVEPVHIMLVLAEIPRVTLEDRGTEAGEHNGTS